MMQLRAAGDRGRARWDWLDSYHSFSFGHYYDPRFMGFRSLRVINEDVIAPEGGFGTHPHRDMEIITYVVSGALTHQDSLGNGSVICPGDVQRMTAGTGIQHSEWNHSKGDPVHLLQIWILPDRPGLPPSYEQTYVTPGDKGDRWCLLAAPDGGAVTLHQDALLWASCLSPDRTLTYDLAPDRGAWVQVVRGAVTVNGQSLHQGDGLAIVEETQLICVNGDRETELLLFDLGNISPHQANP